jgi:hypothetical protein
MKEKEGRDAWYKIHHPTEGGTKTSRYFICVIFLFLSLSSLSTDNPINFTIEFKERLQVQTSQDGTTQEVHVPTNPNDDVCTERRKTQQKSNPFQ